MPRHRREVSRVEGFSDAVFAFGITLLVVSLEVPKTYHELIAAMRAFPTFAVCFALLFQVWRRHYQFFRAYDLEDDTVIALTGVLLFVVLFYVYPLKFLWSLPFARIEGRRITDQIITTAQVPALFTIYGAGVTSVFTILALLYRHAYRMRDQLGLTGEEVLATRIQIYSNVSLAGWGVVSITLAQVLGRVAPNQVGIAGLIYTGIGVSEWIIGSYHGRRLRELNTTRTSPA
ncbi:MAG TPA: TMEM175 family protein [Vicinamibacterales bacterium]|nr:TMEM175 family protein [Vicinamibacterales bacterium]